MTPSPTRRPLSGNSWLEIIDLLAPHAERFKLTGGEPTLHPDFPLIVSHLDELGVAFTVFTNGRWTKPSATLRLLSASKCLAGLLISLHGAEASAHDGFTGIPGSHRQATATIEAAAGSGIPVSISAVLTAAVVAQVDSVLARAKELGARRIVFNRYLARPNNPLNPTNDALRSAVTRISELVRAGEPVRFGSCVPQCFSLNASKGCLAGVAYCAVDSEGYLKPCSRSTMRAGHLLSAPLADLWRGAVMQQFRGALPSECDNCPVLSTCHGGCRALAADPTLGADPLARFSDIPALDTSFRPPRILPADARPVPRYRILSEPWGLVLVRGNRLAPVRFNAAPLLESLDGKTSLDTIQRRFGSSGLALVGSLLNRGLVELG